VTLGNYMDYVTHSLQRVKSSNDSSAANSFWYDRFETGGIQLLRTAERQPGNPFLVARTTSDIINEHGGIWEEDLRNWIIGFLREVQKAASESSRPRGLSMPDETARIPVADRM
jgi:hypothetical protein